MSFLLLHEDVAETYGAVTRTAAATVGAESCSLALYDPETKEVIARRPCYTEPCGATPQFRIPLESSPPSAHVVRTGKPYLSNDPGNDPLYDPSVRERGIRSVLTVPVRAEGLILGLLYALNKPGGFTTEDVRTLTALAGAAAVTLQNIRLYAEERKRRIFSESLQEVSRALVGTPTEGAALAAVLDQMWHVLRFHAASAVVRKGDHLRVAASRGGDVGLEIPLASVVDLRQVLEARQLGMLPDAAVLFPQLGIREGAVKALAVPLLTKGEVLGALVVAFGPDHSPSVRDGELASAFADHAALFLEAGAILRRERQAGVRAAAVARIARIAATRHEPESLLQAVAPELLSVSGADRAVLYLKAGDGFLTRVADAGTSTEEERRVRELRLDLSAAPLALLAQTRKPLVFRASDAPPDAIAPFPQTGSMLLIPLLAADEILGAMLLACVGRHCPFDAAFVEFLDSVAQEVAMGVENARLFSALSQMASTDGLTQLANRRRFTETFRLEMARARRTGAPLSLLLADVDHLKKVNDTYGHPAGDAAIRHVADTLECGRREIDLVARLGGEEFGVLLPGSDSPGAVVVARRFQSSLAASTVPLVGIVTVSIGVATFPEDGSGEEELVAAADHRLYAAKAEGRNRVCHTGFPGEPPCAHPAPPSLRGRIPEVDAILK